MATKPTLARVRDDLGTPVSVYVHELQSSVILSPGKAFALDHPVVKQAAWAFGDESPVEQATAAPGEKRVTKRSS